MFYVYVLKSKIDNSFYAGQTGNLQERIKRHNTGRSVYTKAKMPWELVYFEEFETRIDALHREQEIKSWKSKILLDGLLERPD
jgi:putative endonuclease